MLIILRLQSYSTSTHTNCLIQLLKSGWLRSFVSTEARILQRLLYLSSGYFKKFSKFPYQLQPLALRSTWRLTSAGGEFYSVTICCQLPFSPLSIQASEPKHSTLLTSSNSLIIKEFSVSSAPEVGRIIDRSRGASSTYLNFGGNIAALDPTTLDTPSNYGDPKQKKKCADRCIYSPLL
ncbi:hypothetical protein FX982_00828 [Pseudomonas graminis]|uniref:Uncharacterized protein n=1 Tax=Pseudomonas graminis TaxID=158627 RepID=A0A6M8MJF0_9PSED|nr:hypothetical protein FX982_00828 [Pseudomonas graminis]